MQAILTKATQCLYFLKQLKRAGVPCVQLLHFYLTVIRPVLEYATPVWHHLITKAHTEQVEAVQRRAIRIIYSYTCDMPYINALYIANISGLVDRREQLSRVFFKSILQPTSCLFHTLPPARDLATVTRLRACLLYTSDAADE